MYVKIYGNEIKKWNVWNKRLNKTVDKQHGKLKQELVGLNRAWINNFFLF